jgi:hypothetical protein
VRFLFVSLFLASFALGSPARAEAPPVTPAPRASRTVFVIRHAEREKEPADDPVLTEAGRERARELVRVLAGAGVDGLYASETTRARETLQPLADSLSLVIETGEIDDPVGIARKAIVGGGSVGVIAGHSDTVLPIIEALGVLHHPEFGAITYDDLFVVTIPSSGLATVMRLKYGARVP